jgi:hypothetical protein
VIDKIKYIGILSQCISEINRTLLAFKFQVYYCYPYLLYYLHSEFKKWGDLILGSKREKREALDYFYLFAAFTGINAAAHVASLIGYRSELISLVISTSFNFRILGLIIAVVLLFKLKGLNFQDIKKGSSKNGNLIFIVNLLLLGYVLLITRKMGVSLSSTSAINMLFFSVPMSIALVSEKLLKSDRQSQWLKEVGAYDENVDKRNLFWRFKLDFSHLDSRISRKSLLEANGRWFFMNVVFFVIALSSISQGFRYYNKISLIFLIIIFAKPLLFVIDLIFNLSASLEGECIGFYEHRKRNSHRYYYSYIVTNYKRKIEVKFFTEEEQFFQEGEYVKIYYTLLSRKILKSHELTYFEDN